ncbi:MAG TPA: TlpA disulfide reductase family protein [Bacteroidales bacterium]|nr:TlpA disulfide reductase family protein [Bacteroidales bacterium]
MIRLFIAVLCTISIFSLSGCKSNKAQVSGSLINHIKGEFIFLDKLESDKFVPVDSVKISNSGTFALETKVDNPSFFVLRLNTNNFLTMVVEPDQEIIINAHHDSLSYPVSIEGSEGTRRLAEYNDSLRATVDKLLAINGIYDQNVDNPRLPAIMDSLDSMAQVYLNDINLYTKRFIDDNITSLTSLVALYQQVAPGVNVMNQTKDWRYFVKVDSSLFSSYPDYEPVITLHEQVKELTSSLGLNNPGAPGINSYAPEIYLPNPEGDSIKLTSTRGSYVLLDFWAAWCPPCRAESPNLVKAYDQFHKRGFQIFQVSLDKTKDAWIKGIEDDKLGRWIHVSDIQYWASVVVPLYKIESIPTNYLLDREGRIIAVNLRGDRLNEKLLEIFNKK